MKHITNKTILKQGNREFQPIEIKGIIFWVDKSNTGKIDDYVTNGTHISKINVLTIDDPNKKYCSKILAQSQPKIGVIPVISLDSYVEKLASSYLDGRFSLSYETTTFQRLHSETFKKGYNSNPNQYTQKDIEKAYLKGRIHPKPSTDNEIYGMMDGFEKALKEINSISEIIVDEQFNILSYE